MFMNTDQSMHNKKPIVILAICGSIAAYKACELVRLMSSHSIDTHVLMTRNAQRFIGKVTFETLTGNKVFSTEWEEGMMHIEMKNRADLMVVAPATANMIGKLANGIADDVISSTYLAMQKPVIIAPAMNPGMYNHAAVQRNLTTLKNDGSLIVSPEKGVVICGDDGPGKLASIDDIFSHIMNVLEKGK